MHIIKGNKIYLRPITMQDTNLIVKWRNTEFVRENFIFRENFTAEMHQNWMKSKVAIGSVIQYIICSNSNGAIGSVYFRDIDNENKTAEFGIFIGEKDALGKGYGQEATALFTEYGFKYVGLEKIMLRVIDSNNRAEHVYEKNGFRKISCEKEISYPQGNVVSVIFMEKTNE